MKAIMIAVMLLWSTTVQAASYWFIAYAYTTKTTTHQYFGRGMIKGDSPDLTKFEQDIKQQAPDIQDIIVISLQEIPFNTYQMNMKQSDPVEMRAVPAGKK